MSKTKNCAQCGAEFECLHNAECWCMSVKISKENLKLLQEKFDNCLCKECIRGYEMREEKEISDVDIKL